MNSIVSLGFIALVSMFGMAVGYGSVGTISNVGSGYTGYPSAYYGGNYGYGNVGTFFGGSGVSEGSQYGVFGILIYLFIFITVIRLLSNNDDSNSGSGILGGIL